MRFLARILVGAGVACVVVACTADLSGFADGPDSDAGGAADATSSADAGGPSCATFTCGTLCVQLDDPAFGCSADRNCQPCPGPDNATSTCAGGKCAIACTAPFLDCNGDVADGCEVDPRSDPKNCGGCGKPCSASMPYCVSGACVTNCPNTVCGSSCVDTQTAVADCGGCDEACANPTGGNGTASCSGGKCAYTCASGYADCDTSPANGCETFVKGTDVAHCGSCMACPAPPPNAAASCAAGVCKWSCKYGWSDCNGLASDGCECHLSAGLACNASKMCVACIPQGGACVTQTDCCWGQSLSCQGGTCIYDP